MKLLMVSGTFGLQHDGRPSSVAEEIWKSLNTRFWGKHNLHVRGGDFNKLKAAHRDLKGQQWDIVVWMPHVPDNELEKLRNVKEILPHCVLVTSKRNDNEKYSVQDMVAHALGLRSNLFIEFSKDEQGQVMGRLFDPLGNLWHESDCLASLGEVLGWRIEQLTKFTRVGSRGFGTEFGLQPPEEHPFYGVVKAHADRFHELIHPAEGVTRFLGNASFRCSFGFPSMRLNDLIYMSRRNMDKRLLGQHGFVAVVPGTGNPYEQVVYFGEGKPSVDTPIQRFLYWYYPNLRHMMHSHTYIDNVDLPRLKMGDRPYLGGTKEAIPCGALEEAYAIVHLFPDRGMKFLAMNLKGHGSLVATDSIEDFQRVSYKARPVPEKMETMGWKKDS